MRRQAEKFGTRFITRNVTKVDFSQRPFKVWIGDKLHLSKSIIISTGGECKISGPSFRKNLCESGSFCLYDLRRCFLPQSGHRCGWRRRHSDGGSSIPHSFCKQSVFDAQNEIISGASKIMAERVLKNPKVEVLWNTEVLEVLGDGKSMTGAKIKSTVDNSEKSFRSQDFS